MASESDHDAKLDALFRSARADVPSAAEERALREALAAALGGTGGTPANAPSGARRRWPLRGVARIGTGAAVAALGLGAWLAHRSATREVLPPPTEVVEAPASTPAPPPDVPATEATSPVTPPEAPTRATSAPARPRPARAASTEASEAAILDEARRVLRSDPARALALTDAHRRAYRNGELSEERDVIAIEALARLGRDREAVARADAFRVMHPRSIHLSRIEAALGAPKKSGAQ